MSWARARTAYRKQCCRRAKLSGCRDRSKGNPKEQDAHKQEAVEQRVGRQKLAGNRRPAALLVHTSLADIAEDHT